MYYAFQNEGHQHLLKVAGAGDPDTIRFLCHPTQFVFIQRHLHKAPLEMCSLNQLDDAALASPDSALEAMPGITAAPEHGGWREPSEAEITALYLGTFGHLPLPTLMGLLEPLRPHVQAHPAIRAGACFPFGGQAPLALVSLLSYMYDIRRFVDPKCPGRPGRMKSYFRLNSPHVLLKFFEERAATHATFRPAMAFLAWYSSPYQTLTPKHWTTIPNAFLFRDAYERREEHTQLCPTKEANHLSLWRSTVRFMLFLRMLWTTGLKEKPFVPERFFHREEEIEGFCNFINKPDFRLDNLDDKGTQNTEEHP